MRRTRIHDVSPSDNLDRATLLGAFVIGAGGSLLLKAFAQEVVPKGIAEFAPAVFAAVVLCVYAIVAWAGGRLKVEPETIGDNCYYLGFLFTLTSLAHTLYQVASLSTDGTAVDIREVISGFGLALSSTIVGVFLRVYLMQLRSDFVAKDREVRAEVNRAFGDFKKGMAGMLSQMKAYAVESIQFASERDERIRRSTEQFLKDHQDSLRNSADELSAHMSKTYCEAVQRIEKQILSALEHNQKTNQEQMKVMIDDLQALKDEFRKQELEAAAEIQDRRKAFASELEKTEEVFSSQIETVHEFRKNTLKMLSQIEEYTAKSSQFASDRDERNRKEMEQFLEGNRKLIRDNAEILSTYMEKAFAKAAKNAAREFSLVINQHLVARQAEHPTNFRGKIRNHEEMTTVASEDRIKVIAPKPDDAKRSKTLTDDSTDTTYNFDTPVDDTHVEDSVYPTPEGPIVPQLTRKDRPGPGKKIMKRARR